MSNRSTPKPNHDATPVSDLPTKAFPRARTAYRQIQIIQARLSRAMEDPKTSGSLLAQLSRSWALLETRRQKLVELRAARLSGSGSVSPGTVDQAEQEPLDNEPLMLDSIPGELDQPDESLQVEFRRPPEPTGKGTQGKKNEQGISFRPDRPHTPRDQGGSPTAI